MPKQVYTWGNVKAGDIILEFDGQNINEMNELPRIVAETDVDTIVIVKVWRKNEILDISNVISLSLF